MVEFALAFPLLLVMIFGTVEMSRLLNVYISLNRIAQRAARDMALPDITASRPPTVGLANLRGQLRRPGKLADWHPAYSTLIHALLAAEGAGSEVRVDVNAERAGRLASSVEIQVRVAPLMIPTGLITGQDFGRITLVGRGLAINETQATRRDAFGPYGPMKVPLAVILQHPDEPLPEPVSGTGSP